MIRKIEIKNYRIIRNLNQELRPFNILIGPNATGKSTFLDTISLVRDILNDGLESAIIEKRAPSFSDLLWDKKDPTIKVSLELDLPEKIRKIYQERSLPAYVRSRYELRIGHSVENEELRILEETLWLLTSKTVEIGTKPSLFQKNGLENLLVPPPAVSEGKRRRAGSKKVITKTIESGNDYYFNETTGYSYNTYSKSGLTKSALANLQEDEKKFPGALWTKHKLKEGIQVLTLNSLVMRRPCHPGKKHAFEMDGSNLPIIIRDLRKKSLKRFKDWISHLQTALPFLQNIRIKIRAEDRFLYISINDKNNRTIPSWVLSDGTLRILALTLLAYLPDNEGIYLIEEPENGVHPLAIEPIYQSLSSVYNGQVLVATHSPVFLSVAKLDEILCFSRMETGEMQIIKGTEHPALREWKGTPNLQILYASGVLG